MHACVHVCVRAFGCETVRTGKPIGVPGFTVDALTNVGTQVD
jgi:hypothetical protein